MAYQTFSALFWLYRQRSRNGKTNINLLLTVEGKRVEISTKLHIDPTHWDSKRQCIKRNYEEADRINRQLQLVKADLQRHHSHLMAQDIPITAETLRNKFLGIGEKNRTVKEAIERYIERFTEKVKTGQKAITTLKSLNTTRDKVLAFIRYNFHLADMRLVDIKRSFAVDLEHYLITKHQLSNNSCVKYIKIFKRIIKMAVDQEWLPSNPLNSFTCSLTETKRERLTMDEIWTIYYKKLPIERLSEVRDVFIFCCFTGFAYRDVANLKKENIVTGIDHLQWIIKDREKTGTPEKIPLLPTALEIIERYKNHPWCEIKERLLPVDSNQRMNAYLKEIAVLCGINKHLTTHMARHTFATTITLEHDVPIETVSQMLGHKSIRTTQIYAKVTQVKVSNNMKELKNRIFGGDQDVKKEL